jgi:hypothetical protein
VLRLLIASQYDPWSIIERLAPYIGGSASIVVHSPQVQVSSTLFLKDQNYSMAVLQILSDLYNKLRDLPGYLGTSLTEGFLRKYQVGLLARTRGIDDSYPSIGSSWPHTSYDEHYRDWRVPFAYN